MLPAPICRFNPARSGKSERILTRAATNGGSTPLTRGTHQICGAYPYASRFNPAHAGNSLPPLQQRRPRTVQPRSRGELTISGQFVFDKNGSTPLTRGTPIVKVVCRLASRFNPACAGNSESDEPKTDSPAVQPRLRGELVVSVLKFSDFSRFNPACAGNSPT